MGAFTVLKADGDWLCLIIYLYERGKTLLHTAGGERL